MTPNVNIIDVYARSPQIFMLSVPGEGATLNYARPEALKKARRPGSGQLTRWVTLWVCCPTDGRRNGRTRPRAGRSHPLTPDGPVPKALRALRVGCVKRLGPGHPAVLPGPVWFPDDLALQLADRAAGERLSAEHDLTSCRSNNRLSG